VMTTINEYGHVLVGFASGALVVSRDGRLLTFC
jgi:hypothetical protein